MEFQKEELDEILNIFSQESKEILSSMDEKLLSLEKDGYNSEMAIALFRDAHSLKGSARMLGFVDIQNIAHKIEDVISLIKEEKLQLNTQITDTIMVCLEFIETLINKTVENKEEFKSEKLNEYIQKLEEIEKSVLKQDDKTNDINQNLENLIIDILYTIQNAKKEQNFNPVYELENKTNNLINILNEINKDEINPLKNKAQALFEAIEKFKISENKDLSFLEVYNIIHELTEGLGQYFDNNHILRKNYFETVENMINVKNEDTSIVETKKEDLLSPKVVEFLQRVPLLEINCEFFPDTIAIILNIIEDEQDKIRKDIFINIKDILDVFKQNNVTTTRDITLGIKEIIEEIKSGKDDVIKEAKTKSEVIKTMARFQYKKEHKKTPEEKHELSQKDILNSITNTEIKTLRIDSHKLDNLVGQIGELIVSKIKTNEQLSLAKKISNDLVDWQKNFSKMNYYIKYFDKKYLSKPESHMSDDYRKMIAYNKQLNALCEAHGDRITALIKEMSNLFRQLQESETKLNTTSTEIETMVKNMRILPLSTIFQLFPRMVHNIARDKHKKIDLTIEGSDITADKTIIEEIKIPLMHIIRNSIDHGIEDIETRKRLNKNPVGKIQIIAKYKENKVIIDVKDDGRGLDIEKIKSKALEKGLLTKDEINVLTDEELTNLIFYPGFSTEDFVTELSGRGLGLDIVNNKINQMSGRVDIFSQVNEGTVVRIILPATVATKKVFIIEELNQLYAIETSVIKTILRINSDEIFEKDDNNYYIYNGQALSIYTLSQILNFENTQRETDKYTLMIIETESSMFGIIVERLIAGQEIVHKKLEPPLYKVKNISGITTLANGDACLILSVSDIISTINSAKIGIKLISKNKILKTKDNSSYKILVVDDSHTTRVLQKNILTNCGYNVTTSINPINALEKLKENKYDLIISDIQMPEMNGFEFIKQARNIPNYKDAPIIVVSSESKDKYASLIEETQIKRYIQKADFKQDEFVEIVKEILKNV